MGAEMMAVGKIIYDGGIHEKKGFIQLWTAIACCNRLNGEQLKLLGLIMNVVNTNVYQNNLITEVRLPRVLLRRIFYNRTMESILRSYAKPLADLGFIESYSRECGDDGDFVFVIKDNPLNNPIVLLCVIENSVIDSFRLNKECSTEDLLKAMTNAVNSVEKEFVTRIKNLKASEKEVLLNEYRQYLCDQLATLGWVNNPPKKTPLGKDKGQSTDRELPKDVECWSISNFVTYFSETYKEITGNDHAKQSGNTGLTLENCISIVVQADCVFYISADFIGLKVKIHQPKQYFYEEPQ